jgi:hypothetical protein
MQLQEELRPFVAQQVFVQGSETINVELKRQPTGLCCSENFIAGNSDGDKGSRSVAGWFRGYVMVNMHTTCFGAQNLRVSPT